MQEGNEYVSFSALHESKQCRYIVHVVSVLVITVGEFLRSCHMVLPSPAPLYRHSDV